LSPNFAAFSISEYLIPPQRSSTIYNPFLYAWLNENFRKEFRLIIPCAFRIVRLCRRKGAKGEESEYIDMGGHSKCTQSMLIKHHVSETMAYNDMPNGTKTPNSCALDVHVDSRDEASSGRSSPLADKNISPNDYKSIAKNSSDRHLLDR
jgi:hypothetical protein